MKPQEQPMQLLDLLGKETDRIEELARSMAGVVLINPAHKEEIVTAANQLADASQGVQSAANALEIVKPEAFGDEESYWTAYRMFTIGDNVGKIWSLEEIWQHLAKNYDMSGETLESVADTLFEWKEDIEADAAEKGLRGVFMQHAPGFVFAPRLVSQPIAEVPEKASEIPEPVKTSEFIDKQNVAPTMRERLARGIQAMMHASPDQVIRQADAKRWILKDNPRLDSEVLQAELDALVAAGMIYKFRRNKVAYLSLMERPDENIVRGATDKEDRPKEELIDVGTAQRVLEALCAPRRHVQQKMMINDLWRLVNGVTDRGIRPPDEEIDVLKRLCKQLSARGLVVAASEKIGTGGVKTKSATSSRRRRSGKMHAFKVGLPNQEIKEKLQRILTKQPSAVRAELDALMNPENEAQGD